MEIVDIISDVSVLLGQVVNAISSNKILCVILGCSLFGVGCKAFRKLKRSVN